MKIEGRLTEIGLNDLLDILHTREATCVVNLRVPECAGKIYLRRGEVIHAETGGLRGLGALKRLLTFNYGDGNWCVEVYKAPAEDTIEEDFESLMAGERSRAEQPFATLLDTLVALRILERVDVW